MAARLFEEPLVPMFGEPSAAENKALVEALSAFARRTVRDDFSALKSFVESPVAHHWYPSVVFCLGWEYYHAGYYSKAIDEWEEAWLWGQNESEPKAKALADRTVGELARMYSRIGGFDELESVFGELHNRQLHGSASELVAAARQAQWMMLHQPDISFRCGPLALSSVLEFVEGDKSLKRFVFESASTQRGFALSEVAKLGEKLNLSLQMARRSAEAEILVPSVVHWKVGHYAALLKKSGDRYLAVDPTFGNRGTWVSADAINQESSGYFLVRAGRLPAGWRNVGDTEGQTVWGKGVTGSSDPGSTTPSDLKQSPDCAGGSAGMATYNFHLFLVSLNIEDTPLRCAPPRGPPITFTATYNHREANQPANFSYVNLGQKWTCNWISYIKDEGPWITNDVDYYVAGGGTEAYSYDIVANSYKVQWRNLSQLVRKNTNTYEITFNDGSRQVFSQPDGSIGNTRKVFLTQVIDPTGYTNLVNYSSDLRISTVTDPIANATNLTFYYNSAPLAGPLNTIFQVTDRYGRSAYFGYKGANTVLETITDALSITSQVFYATGSSFINRLKTPYGETTFAYGESGTTRWLEATDPYGDKSRVEFNQAATLGIPVSDPGTTVPQGMYTRNFILNGRNTFYWDKKAMREAAGDYTKARLYHWLHSPNLASGVGVLESYKEPFENRVWFNYPGQDSDNEATSQGAGSAPSVIGRVLDEGQTQLWKLQRNAFGKVTLVNDPIGRQFSYIYAANGIDLLYVYQSATLPPQLVASFTYNSQHLPLTATDAAGQVTRFAYNSYGQLTYVTNALQQVTSFFYDSKARLFFIDGPVAGTGDIIVFNYDSADRVRTVTDVDGYAVTTDYDNFDRPTTNSYPDGTKEIITYKYLDPETFTERDGRFTKLVHNALRQLVEVHEATNWVTRYDYCKCSDLKSVSDPQGRTTKWFHDVQGRITAKEYVDGSREEYTYQATTSLLRSVKNERGQIKVFTRIIDDTLFSVTYSNAPNTPATYFLYDTNFVRPTYALVGSFLWAFDYHPLGSLGGGQIKSIDGPGTNDLISYSYDELGRVRVESIYSTELTRFAYSNSVQYDVLGRLTNANTGIGNFRYAYAANSPRLDQITYPNSQVAKYSYYDGQKDFRLKQITNNLGATSLSADIYDYSVGGRISSWKRVPAEGYSAGVEYLPFYDGLGQHGSMSKIVPSGSPQAAFAFGYDLAGNRTTNNKVGVSSVTASYNPLNEIIGHTGSATARQYEWDAENRLRAIVDGTNITDLDYDGFGKIYRLIERVGTTTNTIRRFTWSGERLVQERISTSTGSRFKMYYPDGYEDQHWVTNVFFTRDHLGSIREVTSANRLECRYDYDPYGVRSTGYTTGTQLDPSFGFTGLYTKHDLNFALFRVYDPNLGRWLSRDPIGEAGGLNLYSYAGNDPINFVDTDGLCPQKGFGGGGGQFRDANTGVIRNANGTRAADQFNPFNPANFSPSIPARAGPQGANSFTKRIHKNSLDYVGETHVYRIVGPDGTTYKIGESARGFRVGDGQSIRAEEQVRRLGREIGSGFQSEIRKIFGSKADAKNYERRLIERFRRMYGEDALPGNKSYH